MLLSKKDLKFGFLAGLLIGLFFLPIFKTINREIFEKFFFFSFLFFPLAVSIGLIIAHYISKKISIIWQIAKFVVIGVLNTFIDLGALSLLIFAFRDYFLVSPENLIFGGSLLFFSYYSLYKGISFIIANINSYFWNKYWTFEKKETKKTGLEYIQFLTVSIVGFIINVFVASSVFGLIIPSLGLNTDQWGLVGGLSGTFAALVWNFVGYKFIVFKK